MRYDISWSYTICAVAAVFSTFSSVCLVVEYVNNKIRRYSKPGGAGGIDNPLQQESNNGRLDRSFTPYTSFPDLENVETNGSVTSVDMAAVTNTTRRDSVDVTDMQEINVSTS